MLSVALKHFGAEFSDEDERDLFSSFATIEDGNLKVFFFLLLLSLCPPPLLTPSPQEILLHHLFTDVTDFEELSDSAGLMDKTGTHSLSLLALLVQMYKY